MLLRTVSKATSDNEHETVHCSPFIVPQCSPHPLRQLPRQRMHRPLAGYVGGNGGARIDRAHRANQDDAAAPLEYETVFTRKVPTDANPLRIWLDPAERICIAHAGGMTVFFPTGRIPRSIAEKMPVDDTPDE